MTKTKTKTLHEDMPETEVLEWYKEAILKDELMLTSIFGVNEEGQLVAYIHHDTDLKELGLFLLKLAADDAGMDVGQLVQPEDMERIASDEIEVTVEEVFGPLAEQAAAEIAEECADHDVDYGQPGPGLVEVPLYEVTEELQGIAVKAVPATKVRGWDGGYLLDDMRKKSKKPD
jgi:hypothetical protein